MNRRNDHEYGIEFEAGDVIIDVTPQPTRNGDTCEWQYRLRRNYRWNGEDKAAFFFRPEHSEDLALGLQHAVRFMSENDPGDWLRAEEAAALLNTTV